MIYILIILLALTLVTVLHLIAHRPTPVVVKTLCPHDVDWDECPDCCH